jgi:hypothetical protein
MDKKWENNVALKVREQKVEKKNLKTLENQ